MIANLRTRPYRVAIDGFGDFERAALASCFRLAEGRMPAYVQVESSEASDFLIVDADQDSALDRVAHLRRDADTVFIGSRAPEGAVAWLVRPIEPVHIMRALDALLLARLGARTSATPAPAAAAVAPPPAKRRPNPMTARGGGGRPVLVVDDSRIARAFLAQRLAGLGYRVSVAASGDEALEMSGSEAFAIVFLDLRLGDHDVEGGLQVCRSIKERPSAPAVVVTTASHGASDRVRGTLAGCDAYLTKPLLAAAFTVALRQVDPLFAGLAGG